MRLLTRKSSIFIPVIVAVIAIMLLQQNKKTPEQIPHYELKQTVSYANAQILDVSPQIITYGTVKPGKSWHAFSRVKGKVVYKYPNLKKGAIIESGTLLFQIDPVEYQLAIAQIEAEISGLEAQISELSIKEKNTAATLDIEEAALKLAQNELTRKKKLASEGSVSSSDLESQQRILLQQQQVVLAHQNTLRLLPSQKRLLEAQLKSLQSRLESEILHLSYTETRMPFTGRVAETTVEMDQYVREGDNLVTADDLSLAEIELQIPIVQMNILMNEHRKINTINTGQRAYDQLGISVLVQLNEGSINANWEGRFARISDTLDPKTRTIGMIVEVDRPYQNIEVGRRPPLAKGMFVKVILKAKTLQQQLVIPASALHNAKIYLINNEDRLEIRDVNVVIRQPDYLVIDPVIENSDRVVISDLSPAIDGMLLSPVESTTANSKLRQVVTGMEF